MLFRSANIDAETGLEELGWEGSFDYSQQQINGPGQGLFMLDPTGDHVKQIGRASCRERV